MPVTLDPATNTNSGTLSNGNLTYAATSASGNVVRSTTFATTSKFYLEYTMTTVGGGGYHAVGVVQQAQATTTPTSLAAVPAGMWIWRDDAFIANNGASSSLGTSAVNGSIAMVACDPGAGKLWFGRNGTWFGTGDPGTGANAHYTNLTGAIGAMVNMLGTSGSPVGTINFGATAFSYSIPVGFAPLGFIALNANFRKRTYLRR